VLTKFDRHIEIDDPSVLFQYSGVCNMKLFHKEIESVKGKIELSDEHIQAAHSMFNILVEALQNLHKNAIGDVDVRVWSKTKEYISATRNVIENSFIPELESKLLKINSLDRKDLRKWKMRILNETEGLTEDSRAGVGLIDIAIKTRNKLGFSFEKKDENFSYFSLEMKVNKENK